MSRPLRILTWHMHGNYLYYLAQSPHEFYLPVKTDRSEGYVGRFFFNPIRYTSLGLAVCEAMMIGMPVLGLATTEMATTIENGISGYVSTDVSWLIGKMKELLADPTEARRLGEGACRKAQERFHIKRFIRDWDETFRLVTAPPMEVWDLNPINPQALYPPPVRVGISSATGD